MSQLSELIDKQQLAIDRLDNILSNLSKLGIDKRTREVLGKAFEKAGKNWDEILSNHKNLVEQGIPDDPTYFEKLNNAVIIGEKIESFITKHFPDLVQISLTKCALELFIELPKSSRNVDNGNEISEEDVSEGSSSRQAPTLEDELFQEFLSFKKTKEKEALNSEEKETARKQAEKFQEILNCQKLKEENEIKVKNENSQIAMLMQMVANQQRWMEMQNKVESPKHGGLRLPQVDLLSFDGNIKNYKAFQDIFETVMKKSQLDPIERFTILRSKLSGDALNAVINLSLTEGNYLIAWEILNKRFLNKRISIEVNMKDIIFGPETVAKKADSLLQFMQGYQNAMHNLKDLGIDVNVESGCWMYPIMKRMDSYTLSRFEDFIGCTSEMPTVDQLNTFMEQEYSVNVRRQEEEPKKIINSATTRTYATMDQREFRTSDQKQFKCFLCKENHAVINCSIFKTSEDRIALLKEHKLCIYCGKHKWMYQVPCQQRDRLKCEIEDCGQQHLTELHPKSRISKSFLSKNESQDSSSGVIIPTAIINVLTDENNITKVRCLIDQCSQGSYITEDLVQKLKLKKKRINVKIIGVGGVEVGHVQSLVTIQIKLDDPSLPVIKTKAFVVRKVTSKLPAIPMHIDLNNNDKKLADPFFNKPAHIPILLGSNVLVHIFSNGTEKINNLLYQNTLLGWIVSGSTSNIMAKQVSTHVSINEFEDKLIKFWDMPIKQATEIEEISDEHCEKLYQDQVTRNQEGRYMVPTPWKKDAPELGSSYNKAVSFFLGQENRWYKNPTHKQKSDEFMKEYLELGHMSPIPLEEQKDKSGDAYYIPYISILRKDAVTTKLRNVFNASSPSSNGITLNNQIHSGPKLQTHIFDLITSVRKHQFIYSSDVTKMYRQILIKPEDREKHRVIWRPSRDYPLMEYRLNTITYGLDCAPWQAIRTLHQIADDNAPDEQTKDIIKKGFYMDDLLDGNETIEQCQEQIGKIISTLEAGKLSLTKWVANDSRILANIEPAKKISAYIQLTDSEPSVKTLGLLFNPNDDFFSFKVKEYPDVTYTKRGLLSIAASLYDPIGWILPVVMKFRILVQSLWQLTYDWDDKIDVKTQRKFEKSLASIAQLGEVQIPRWTGNTNKSSIHFIGFCDASQDAYAAVIYSRVQVKEGFQICLIASKGRVTPLKTKVNQESKVCTIPKLELEGIVLLMELYEDVSKNYTNLNITFTVYTDSEVALAWVRNHKELNNKFIKRRVAKIRQVIKPFDIHYVKSAENPADPASRGLNTDQLLDCHIWFNGPDWLHNETLPTTPFKEEITTTTYVSQVKELNETSFLERFSNWNHLRRTVARILRWKNKNSGPITAEEIATAEKRIVKYQQQRTFQKELKLLSKNLSISPKHWLSMLTPYINNDDGFLRVGGELEMLEYQMNKNIQSY